MESEDEILNELKQIKHYLGALAFIQADKMWPSKGEGAMNFQKTVYQILTEALNMDIKPVRKQHRKKAPVERHTKRKPLNKSDTVYNAKLAVLNGEK